MQPRIELLSEKKLIGKKIIMTLANNRTPELWRSFMPERKNITNTVSPVLFSMQIYPSSFSQKGLTPNLEFEKWAAVEVSDFNSIPEGMETYTIKGGRYAVFHYKGDSRDISIFQYIFGTWIPQSTYTVDSREHFELLGEKYKNNDPNSEEEIWIPIKERS